MGRELPQSRLVRSKDSNRERLGDGHLPEPTGMGKASSNSNRQSPIKPTVGIRNPPDPFTGLGDSTSDCSGEREGLSDESTRGGILSPYINSAPLVFRLWTLKFQKDIGAAGGRKELRLGGWARLYGAILMHNEGVKGTVLSLGGTLEGGFRSQRRLLGSSLPL